MGITKAAQANHDELFPGHQSTLAVTDPEFVELFGNFAFDEVVAHGSLGTQIRLKVILASLIAMQTVSEYRILLGGALTVGGAEPQLRGHIQGNANVGHDKATLLAVVTQLLPYVGYPRALNTISCINEVLPEPG